MKKYSDKSLREKSNKVIALIPVRGGSKSIPLKNIKPFCEKPLVYWTVKAAADCDGIDQVIVATDSKEIKEVVLSFGLSKVIVYDRSESNALDHSPTEDVMLEVADRFIFDNIILIQATSPLLESQDLKMGLDKYRLSNADSLISAVRQKRFIWEEKDTVAYPLNYDPLHRPRRQEWDGYLVENGAFYITTYSNLMNSRCRISGSIAIYEMTEDTYFEIDEPSDWIIAERLKRARLKQRVDLSAINLLISDVDGVLTDAGMYYSSDGQELKKFNTRDGKGIELLRETGKKVMLLTSENIELVRKRAEKLKVDFLYMGIKDKRAFLESFFKEHPEHSFQKTAYIGDDVNDLESLMSVAFSASPKDGHNDVKAVVDYICPSEGGRGCVRDVCDYLLNGRKAWD
ncbi:hypothetical protein QYF50_00965 [Paenibacillus vini]|uniref:acylneuraminate cytidylyltransferase n=1 Tax=Paenibacillus vini TaxID=1476024 RepID=UPI0025B660B4|nr:acylneuraminate cytidylyltransferase [Paenibacillus vini]MDN4066447.1 hypothetical protein [Paenibacillus vini]